MGRRFQEQKPHILVMWRLRHNRYLIWGWQYQFWVIYQPFLHAVCILMPCSMSSRYCFGSFVALYPANLVHVLQHPGEVFKFGVIQDLLVSFINYILNMFSINPLLSPYGDHVNFNEPTTFNSILKFGDIANWIFTFVRLYTEQFPDQNLLLAPVESSR